MFDKKVEQPHPKGTEIRSGAPQNIPTVLLYQLLQLFASMGCVADAFVVIIQAQKPDGSAPEPAHYALEVRIAPESGVKLVDIHPKIGEVITKSGGGVGAIDIIDVESLPQKLPLAGSLRFFHDNTYYKTHQPAGTT